MSDGRTFVDRMGTVVPGIHVDVPITEYVFRDIPIVPRVLKGAHRY